MADERAKRIAEPIKPLKVKPGSKVNLARDFDPGGKGGFLVKEDGAGMLRTGIEPRTGVELLAGCQRRLAAQAAPRAERAGVQQTSGSEA